MGKINGVVLREALRLVDEGRPDDVVARNIGRATSTVTLWRRRWRRAVEYSQRGIIDTRSSTGVDR